MAKVRLDKDAYLYGMQHAYNILKEFKGDGMKALEQELKARTGGMNLPAAVDFCVVTQVARDQIKPELQTISVAMAWALEKGLKLPSSRIAIFLDHFNDRIDIYRTDPERKELDSRILDQSWGGALEAGKKWFEMYEERRNKEDQNGEEVKGA